MRNRMGIIAVIVFFFSIVAVGISPVFSEENAKMDFSFGRMGSGVPPVTCAPKGNPAAMAPSVKLDNGIITVENTHYRIKLQIAPFLAFTSIFNKYTQTDSLVKDKVSRPFFVWIDGKRLESGDFKVEKTKVAGRKAQVFLDCSDSGVKAIFSIVCDQSPEFQSSLTLSNQKKEPAEIKAVFPYLENVCIGDNIKDNYYFFPYLGGICGNEPADLITAYGSHGGSIQLVAFYNPQLGGGLYTRVDDKSGRMKSIIVRKRETETKRRVKAWPNLPEGMQTILDIKDTDLFPKGIGEVAAFYYPYAYHLNAGEGITLPAVFTGVHAGDFRVALNSYGKWLHTWFKPLDTPQWYKDNFNYPVCHDTLGNLGFEKGFIRDNKIVLSESAQPWTHYIQLAYWEGPSKDDHLGDKRDYPWYKYNLGDFTYNEVWGGSAAWREEIKKCNQKGAYVILYGSTPWALWAYSDVFQKHPDWALVNEKGEVQKTQWGDYPGGVRLRIVDTCPQVEAFQDYIAETNGRIIRDTGANGVYLDTMNDISFCYDKKHKHYEYPSIAAEKILKKTVKAVRAANPQAIVDIELPGSDYLSQFYDGTWLSTFTAGGGDGNAQYFDSHSVAFLRFLLPEVKFAEWGGAFNLGARRTFFNGIGNNWSDSPEITDKESGKVITREQQLAYFIATGQVMRENGDAFSSLHPECLVPTLQTNLLANRFPTTSKVVYTLYNKNEAKLEGTVLKTPPGSGYHCVELLYDNEAGLDSKTGIVSMSIPAWEVVCLAKFPEIMKLNSEAGILTIHLTKKLASPSIRIIAGQDTGRDEGKKIKLTGGKISLNLKGYQAKRLIIKLFSGKYLADERIVEM